MPCTSRRPKRDRAAAASSTCSSLKSPDRSAKRRTSSSLKRRRAVARSPTRYCPIERGSDTGWTPLVPVGRGLEALGQLEQLALLEGRTDELERDRQTVRVEAAGEADRRQAGEVAGWHQASVVRACDRGLVASAEGARANRLVDPGRTAAAANAQDRVDAPEEVGERVLDRAARAHRVEV